MNVKRYAFLSVGLLLLLALMWMFRSDLLGSSGRESQSLASLPKEPPSGSLGSGVVASVDSRVGQSQRPSLGRADKPWRQLTLTKAELEAHPKIWMLAYSEQDAAWLERFGYPTMDEELGFEQAPIDRLRMLADAGDQRARINLGLKLAESAMKSGDAGAFQMARLEIGRALVEGGPYQAAKTTSFFVALAKGVKQTGELDIATRQGLQNDLLPYYELARGLSSAVGDFAAIHSFNGARDIGPYFGLPSQAPVSFDVALGRLAYLNRARARSGLAPYSLELRPSPLVGPPDILSFQASNTVLVR